LLKSNIRQNGKEHPAHGSKFAGLAADWRFRIEASDKGVVETGDENEWNSALGQSVSDRENQIHA
jgi:hypothetical protein